MSGKVVLFGLDGATFTVLDDLVRRGVMPHLGEFIARGARGILYSTIPPLTPPAWTTLVTGRSPGAHGIFSFLQFESSSSPYLRITNSRTVACEKIWSIVSRAGKRAGSLNFVNHNPPERINGYIIPGWVPWRWVKKHTHPDGLIDQLKEAVPGFDVEKLAMNFEAEKLAVAGVELQDYESWIDLHVSREQQWFNVLRHQMVNDPCDLTGIVFDGVDKLQHMLWQYLDPDVEPVVSADERDHLRERCWDYFRMIDGFLGETVRIAGDDALILIVSDHGFCGTTEIVYINTWLEQQGYLNWRENVEVEAKDSQSLGDAHPYHLTHMDLSKTRAFANSAGSNGIHIPVAGVRGEHGIPSAEYESFRAELADALLTRCVDPITDEPLVTRVWTREEAFAGERMDFAPDLMLTIRDGGVFSVLRSDTVVRPRPAVMGCHHPEGVFAACGPGVRANSELSPVTLLDIAPTALNALGIPIPEDLEGSVINEMFTGEYRDAHPVQHGPPTRGRDGKTPVETDESGDAESEAQVLMRLRALGYIE